MVRDGTEGPDYRIARTRDGARIGVDRTRTLTKLANKAILNARKITGFGLVQTQVVEATPHRDEEPGERTASNPAEPPAQERRIASGNPVRYEEVDVFLEKDTRQDRGCSAEYGPHRSRPVLEGLRI